MNREKFPILKNVVYLDSAAAALKPIDVIKAMDEFYLEYPINTHSSDSRLGVIAYNKINETRELVANLVGAKSDEVIFTSGTTDSLNKIALMLEKTLKANDEILVSFFNHTSNIVPWMEIAKKTKAKLVFSKDLIKDMSAQTKIIAYAQVNNTLDEKYLAKEIFTAAKKVNALVINDAAQAIAHENVSLEDADVIAFSGNKLYGPTGVGVLIVKKALLETLEPVTFGGGAVADLTTTTWVKKDSIFKYEPGTLNSAGIIGLGAAIKYFSSLKNFHEHEIEVATYAYDRLSKIKDVIIYSARGDVVILFNVNGFASQDVVSYLGHKDIILRAGSHCARCSAEAIGFKESIRASIAHYNTKEDIDILVKALENGGDFLEFI